VAHSQLWRSFLARAGLTAPDLPPTVIAISQIPYGRPGIRDAIGVVDEWRGTCSTKHLLLAELVNERWPDRNVKLWHRVSCVTQEFAREHWGSQVAACVPPGGLIDVHTFATVNSAGRRIVIDITFPVAAWDGISSMNIASSAGDDYAAGDQPLQFKEQLVRDHCDPLLREPFIAALSDAAS
jgi:hypothetical protein